MQDWTLLFGSYSNSGVYSVTPGQDVDGIKEAAVASGLDFLHIDLKRVKRKAGFLKKVSRVLDFPEYFGMNWDAFSDCLTDMAWRSAAGYVLLFSNFKSFARNAPADMDIARRIFASSTEYWKQQKTPFYIILSE